MVGNGVAIPKERETRAPYGPGLGARLGSTLCSAQSRWRVERAPTGIIITTRVVVERGPRANGLWNGWPVWFRVYALKR